MRSSWNLTMEGLNIRSLCGKSKISLTNLKANSLAQVIMQITTSISLLGVFCVYFKNFHLLTLNLKAVSIGQLVRPRRKLQYVSAFRKNAWSPEITPKTTI